MSSPRHLYDCSMLLPRPFYLAQCNPKTYSSLNCISISILSEFSSAVIVHNHMANLHSRLKIRRYWETIVSTAASIWFGTNSVLDLVLYCVICRAYSIKGSLYEWADSLCIYWLISLFIVAFTVDYPLSFFFKPNTALALSAFGSCLIFLEWNLPSSFLWFAVLFFLLALLIINPYLFIFGPNASSFRYDSDEPSGPLQPQNPAFFGSFLACSMHAAWIDDYYETWYHPIIIHRQF